MKQNAVLTEGSIARHLTRMTVPMVGGVLAMMAFNATDTYFVSRLGTPALAAMSFTFPVVMVFAAAAMGLGIGASSCISHAIGEGDRREVRRLTSDCLVLTVLIVGILAVGGLLTLNPLFRLLGATEDIIALIRQYMIIWYACVAVLIVPIVANHAIRATGDTLTPSFIMVLAFALNVVLDPIMIFGLFGFPRLELTGAALATAVSRAVSLVAALVILHFRCGLIDLTPPGFRQMFRSWARILRVGVPAALASILMPLSRGAITRMVAVFGPGAVAAMGAGTRVEHLAYVVPIAMNSTLVPLIGQNRGAGKNERARETWLCSTRFVLVWGLLSFLVFLPGAAPIARLFSKDPAVVQIIARYLWIMLLGSGMLHVSLNATFSLNALGKPVAAALYTGVRILGLVVPFAFIGSHLLGLNGLFGGVSLAYLASGMIALLWVTRQFGD